MNLVKEILLEPRWDQKEFTLIKQQTLSQIRQQEASPRSVAENTFNKLIYGENNVRAKNILGNKDSVTAISLEDLQTFYLKNISPNQTRVHVVGAIDKKAVLASLSELKANWPSTKVAIPSYDPPIEPKQSKVYFYDIPNAKQTVVNIGYLALAVTDKDYYPATIINYILGGGGFASQLTQGLREGKGYTYGINSRFSGSKDPGIFRIFSQVRSNVTLESAELIKEILENYGKTYSQQDLATSKSFLIKSNARAFETANAKLGLLNNISKYDWPEDYVKQREKIVKNITIQTVKTLADKYLDPKQMIWFFVGDANTQLARMKALGFGEPILLNPASPQK
jgi:zinc protease